MKQTAGARYYKKQLYKKAFEILNYAAKKGFKQSQYLLGIMYLKGQHVNQSLFYGMAWLGVAKESKSKDWVELFDNVYATATPAQQQAIDASTAKFNQKYGMKTQQMTCSKREKLGGRKKQLECTKNSQIFDLNRSRNDESALNNGF
jgi:hypothetical protein